MGIKYQSWDDMLQYSAKILEGTVTDKRSTQVNLWKWISSNIEFLHRRTSRYTFAYFEWHNKKAGQWTVLLFHGFRRRGERECKNRGHVLFAIEHIKKQWSKPSVVSRLWQVSWHQVSVNSKCFTNRIGLDLINQWALCIDKISNK